MKVTAKSLYRSIGLIVLSGIHMNVFAQNNITLSSYNNETVIKASGSITLAPGFYIPAGKTVDIFIAPNSLAPFVPFTGVPSADQNYIAAKVFKVPGILTDQDVLAQRTTAEVSQTIQYLDGQGRPVQTVITQGSPSFQDMISPVVYDAFGREAVKYQPYAASSGTNGNFRSSALTEQSSYYLSPGAGIKATSSPFSVDVFEPSPLNRVLEQGAPGDPWQPVNGHTAKLSYATNITDEVKLWIVTATGADGSTNYPAGTLYKTVTKDENWVTGNLKMGTVEEFKDFDGRVVLKRTWESDVKSLSTYYVYDDPGNLCYVLPPAVNTNGTSPVNSFSESDQVYDQYIYGYHYDGRKRIIEKKIPGKGLEEMIYNQLDQLVFTQDGNQRASQQRSFIKYDALGRVIMSGVQSGHTLSRADLQAAVDAQPYLWEIKELPGYYGYSNRGSLPGTTSTMRVDLVNYYDDYNFPDNIFGAPDPGKGQVTDSKTRGLLTATKTAVLGGTMLLSVHYYDEKGQLLESKSQHHLGGTDIVDNTWDFAGELTAMTRTHQLGTSITTIKLRYDYDHQGRKVATMQSINGQPEVVLSKLDYTDLGQLKSKNLHSIDGGDHYLQQTDFSYNERGWLKTSASAQFSESLKYEDGTVPQWNGNISNQNWGTGNVFQYNYDALNRLTAANSTGIIMSESLSYDVMGNISQLTRDGQSGTYSYTGNRLDRITGALATGAYGYDANGNATTDGRNGVTLSYNYLNLPVAVSKSGLSMAYAYDATGNKLRKVSGNTTTDYIEGIQYTNGVIDFIRTEEGLARNNAGTYSYEYNLTDHLGNVRASFYRNPVSGNLEVIQQDNYYGFGLRKVAQQGSNKYLYNGKELQDELTQYDYGFRFYDPVIGRWNVIDAKAELYKNITPYVYAANTPVNAIDPDGHLVIFINGFTAFDRSIAGNQWYWRQYTDVNKMLRPPQQWMDPGSWRTERVQTGRAFDLEVSKQLGDNHRMYIDGQSGYIDEFRSSNGTIRGYKDAPAIIESLHRTNGVIDETIKIITHSMGGVFGGGYLEGIKEYLNDHPDLKKQVSITLVADFDPYEASSIINDGSTKKQQFKHANNLNIAGLGWLANENEQGLDKSNITTNSGKSTDHSIFSFLNDISSLSEGTYKWNGNNWIKQK